MPHSNLSHLNSLLAFAKVDIDAPDFMEFVPERGQKLEERLEERLESCIHGGVFGVTIPRYDLHYEAPEDLHRSSPLSPHGELWLWVSGKMVPTELAFAPHDFVTLTYLLTVEAPGVRSTSPFPEDVILFKLGPFTTLHILEGRDIARLEDHVWTTAQPLFRAFAEKWSTRHP